MKVGIPGGIISCDFNTTKIVAIKYLKSLVALSKYVFHNIILNSSQKNNFKTERLKKTLKSKNSWEIFYGYWIMDKCKSEGNLNCGRYVQYTLWAKALRFMSIHTFSHLHFLICVRLSVFLLLPQWWFDEANVCLCWCWVFSQPNRSKPPSSFFPFFRE